MDIKLGLLAGLALLLFSFSVGRSEPAGPAADGKVEELLKKMTLDEKVGILSGRDMDTPGVERLGIPPLKMSDGPAGVRRDRSTCFPSPIAMASSWDTELINRIGRTFAEEMKAKGRYMLLAPCINLNRVPVGGRNFESFGEDPYLTSRIAVSYIKGVQQERVIATPKHYACNNQEWERGSIDVIIDERTLREIYLPAFEAAVKEAGAWSVMAAYNKVNGFHSSENNHLLNDILKNEWGFKGFVVSDWGATHSTVNAANFGLDVEMPNKEFFNEKLASAVKNGQVKESVVDDKVRRILRAMFAVGVLDKKSDPGKGALNTPEHKDIAFQSAREGIVLLKNESGVLPININSKTKSIALIGPNAAVARIGGGGSSKVNPFYSISPLDGLKNRIGDKATINYALGCILEDEVTPVDSSILYTTYNNKRVNGLSAEYFNNKDLEGAPVIRRIDKQINFDWGDGSPAKEIDKEGFSARWTGKLVPPSSDEYEFILTNDDGSRLYINGKLLIDDWGDHAAQSKTARIELAAGKEYDLRLEYYQNYGLALVKLGWNKPRRLLTDAIDAAKRSDVVIVCAGFSDRFESEGFDRNDMSLPGAQDELISKLAEVNKNIIVVLNTGAPVLMNKWIDKVPAVIEAWYPGQECGNAIADVLLGNYNPSGKLPVTFPLKWEDCPAYSTYPGKDGKTYYSEGIFVGYRHFDKKNIDLLFPFGHGLSYTTFQYGNIKISPDVVTSSGVDVNVSFDLKNTGGREGAEVAQLYIREIKPRVERPVKELKGFQRVNLKPGETKTVNFKIDRRALSFYDVGKKDWASESGEFEVLIGSSSQDIRLKGTFHLENGRLM